VVLRRIAAIAIFDVDMDNLPITPRPSARQRHQVGVVICTQHSLGSLGLLMDVFRMANQLPGGDRFVLHKVSENGHPVPHVDGILAVDAGPATLADMDLVLIPSLWTEGPAAVCDSPALIEALRTLPERTLVVTMCTGAYLLAASGRLDNLQATTHWMLADGFQAQFPRVLVRPDRNLTHEGNLICSGGSMAGLDACLHAVQLLSGRDTARQLSQWLVTDLQHGPQTQFMPAYGWRRHGDVEIRRIQDRIEAQFAHSLTLDGLAASIHVSVRTLQRRFLAATGMTPMQYQQVVRIERSKALLEGRRMPVADIAAQVGYLDRVAFGRLFKKSTGLTPAAYRQKQSLDASA
jgi:AraC family transcriptional activator FtrA